MDGLRQDAPEIFEKVFEFSFNPTFVAVSLDIEDIQTHPNSDTKYTRDRKRPQAILEHAKQVPPKGSREDVTAALQLVTVKRLSDFRIMTERDTLRSLLRLYRIETYILYLMARNVDGFHHFKEHPILSDDEAVYSFFLNVRGSYMLAWSYEAKRSITRAVFLQNRHNESFQAELNMHKGLISHPLFLPFVCGVNLLERVNNEIQPEVGSIALVERRTGHSPWQMPDDDGSSTEEINLAVLSSMVSATSVVLALHIRFLRIVAELTQVLIDDSEEPWSSHLSTVSQIAVQSSRSSMATAARLLSRQVDSNRSYIEFLQQRTRTQLTVLFNLIAKEDVNANIELAKDSKTLALATKHDSSSMKTIAALIMAFLPATFFAALFAVPLLEWNSPSVISKRFWLYWAFTLPSTALIFIVWIVLRKRESIRRRLEERRQRAKVVKRAQRSMRDVNHDSESTDIDVILPPTKRMSWMERKLRRRRKETGDVEVDQRNTMFL